MFGVELAGSVLGAGLGEPGADLDGVAVDSDRLAGRGDAVFAVEEELENLDGLGKGAPGCRGRRQGGGGGKADGRQKVHSSTAGPISGGRWRESRR